jgi:predicted LPLAT superfamily acyltransferase
MVALRRTPTVDEIFAESLAQDVHLPSTERAGRLQDLTRRYAARLEAYCLDAPYQWFNFFDFWDEEGR